MVTRYRFPRLVHIPGYGFRLAYSHSTANFMGHDTIVAYAIHTLTGTRRVWAF